MKLSLLDIASLSYNFVCFNSEYVAKELHDYNIYGIGPRSRQVKLDFFFPFTLSLFTLGILQYLDGKFRIYRNILTCTK